MPTRTAPLPVPPTPDRPLVQRASVRVTTYTVTLDGQEHLLSQTAAEQLYFDLQDCIDN